jgi:hypothetical protein
MRVTLAVLGALIVMAPLAHAKKFQYSSGPKPSADTTFSVAETELEPVTSSRGPKVAPTNLNLVGMVADAALMRTVASAPLDSGMHVLLAPAEGHPLNFVIEHAALRALAKRGISVTVRRTLIPDDSLLALAESGGDPVLEYQLASARITYLRLIGGYLLPSRVKVERQALVQGTLTLRDPTNARVTWVGDVNHNLVDVFPRNQLKLIEDERFTDLKAELPDRNLGRLVEPIIVVAVVAGLVVLFFQNRP